MNGILERAVVTLLTLRHVCVGVEDKNTERIKKSDELWAAVNKFAGLGGLC